MIIVIIFDKLFCVLLYIPYCILNTLTYTIDIK